MKKKITVAATFVLTLVTLLTACIKKDGILSSSGNECTIKGRLVQDCSGTPVANYPLSIFQPSDVFGSVGGIRGTGSTDANGYFNIHLTDLNGRETEIEKDNGNPNLGPIHLAVVFSLNYGNAVNDVGIISSQCTFNAVIKLKINATYGLNDTLFIQGPVFLQTIYPIMGSALVTYSRNISSWYLQSQAPTRQAMFWGIGKRDLDSAFNAGAFTDTDTPGYHKFIAKTAVCRQIDTTFITIP